MADQTKLIRKSVEALREDGYLAERVEHFNYWTQRRHDLFRFADVIGVRPSPRDVLLVQVTHMDRRMDHVRKLQAEGNVGICKAAGIRVELWSWRKLKEGKAQRWAAKRDEL
jgi:hypothetical protein